MEKPWRMWENIEILNLSQQKEDGTIWCQKQVIIPQIFFSQLFTIKPVYLGLSILELSKILIYGFWYYYVKPRYDEKAKLYYMDTDGFIVYIKTDDIYKNIAEDIETRFDTSNFELDRPLPKGKNKKVIGLMKDELGGKIITKSHGLRAKTCSYLMDGGREDKKAKGTKKCVIKRKLKFENYKNC